MNVVCEDDSIGHWVTERTGDDWHAGKGRTMGFYEGGQLVCGVVFYDYNGRTVWMGMATDGEWASPETFHAVADYAYRQLNCEWVRCRIAATNLKSCRLVESVGFELETLLENSHPAGDERIYRLSRENCKWLFLERSREEFKKQN